GNDIRCFAEGRAWAARHRDDGDAQPLDDRQNRQQLGRVPGSGKREEHVVRRDHPSISVSRFSGMKEERRRSGARKRCCNLVADMPRLAHSGYDDAALAFVQESARLHKGYLQAFADGSDRGDLGVEHAPGACKKLLVVERSSHERIITRRLAKPRSAPPNRLISRPAHEFLRCPDRKSTRLNSSHVKISYAVFCLKKKN